MSNNVVRLFAVACLTSAAFVGSANAQTNSDDAMRRLEAKIDALAKENSSLRSRLTRVESQPRAAKPKQEQGYVGPIGKPTEPTAQQVNQARESFAADLPVAVKYAPPPRPACAQFGGFYVGGNVGANYYTNDWKDRDNFGFNYTFQDHVGDASNSRAGWNAGGQLGWDYQAGCTIWGVVADMNWASTKIDVDYTDFPTAGNGTLNYQSQLNWFGTARTRAGVVVDNLLLYVTGGFAFAGFDRNLTYTLPGVRTATFSDDSAQVGFVVGFGTSWNLGNNWSFGTEVLYMGFQKDQVTLSCAGCGGGFNNLPFRYEFNDSIWVTRFNLNYRFGDYGKGPVLAKY